MLDEKKLQKSQNAGNSSSCTIMKHGDRYNFVATSRVQLAVK